MAMQLLDTKISIRNLFSLITSIILLSATALILYGLNSTISNDISNYEIIWGLIHGVDFFQSFQNLRYEFGSFLILWIFANFFSAGTMFYLTGLMALSIKYYLFNKYLHYPLLAYVIYVLTFAHILDANQIRVALAVCVIFYATFISPKSKFTYLFLSIVAVLFHYSGVIILFLYFVRRPVLGLSLIVFLGFSFDIIISSSDYFAFALIWHSDPLGNVNLTSSLFIMQVCISILCAVNWRTLSEGQKRGAFINMVGVVIYISFLDNAIVAHRMRELSQIGIFAILFLGKRNLTAVKLITSICLSYIVAYNLLLVFSELMSIFDVRL